MRFTMFHSQFWNSKRVRALDSDERLCLVYIMTCQHANSAACMRLPPAYAAADLSWEQSRYRDALAKLAADELVVHDPDTDEIFVRGWFRWNTPAGSKAEAGARKFISLLESSVVRDIAEAELREAVCKPKPSAKNRALEPNF